MSPTDETMALNPHFIGADDELKAVGATKSTGQIEAAVDNDGQLESTRLTEELNPAESSPRGQDNANPPATTMDTSPVGTVSYNEDEIETAPSAGPNEIPTPTIDDEERLREVELTEMTEDSLFTPDDDFACLQFTAASDDTDSDDIWSRFAEREAKENEQQSDKSDDMENETDPNLLHGYIAELKDGIRELQELRDNAVSELRKYENPYSVGETWMCAQLVAIHELLQSFVDRLPDWQDVLVNWPLVNELLVTTQSVFLSADQTPSSEILPQVHHELLMFAAASLLWKTLFEPMLLGATAAECLLLQKIQNGIKTFEPPKHPDVVNILRADIFRAMAASEDYHDRVNQECKHTSNLIMQIFEIAGYSQEEIPNDDGSLWYLREGILGPAAELATKMRGSEDTFYWSWEIPRPMMKKRDLRRFEVFDLEWHCTMVQSEFHFSDLADDDTLGDCLFSVFPTLYKKGKGNEEDTVVSRGWAVVILHPHLANCCGVGAKEPPQDFSKSLPEWLVSSETDDFDNDEREISDNEF